ncbi:ribonuclease H-like domain-containing protein [Tanacetum coccineum]
MSGEEPATQIAPVESPQMVSTVKLPILKKGEYTLWSMRMEQYLTNKDSSLWQVILNGYAPIQVTTDENGVETEVPPKTAQALLQRQRERKAKSILLLSILDEYQLRFHRIKDAKSLWAAIKSRFGGNVESKKMQKNVLKQQFENFSVSDTEGLDKAYDRFQKLISLLEVHGAAVPNKDANQEFLRALPSSWNNVALIMRNKDGSFGSSSNSQNVAFLSTEDTSSSNEVNTANGVSTVSGHNSQGQASSSSYIDDLMFPFFSNQSNSPQLDDEDLEQIDLDDLEEMDLKWQCFDKHKVDALTVIEGAILQGNVEHQESKTGMKIQGIGAGITPAGLVRHIGLESVEAQLVVHQKNEAVYEEKIAVLEFEVKDKSNAFETSSKNLNKLINSQLSSKDKTGLGYGDQLNENDSSGSELFNSVFDSRSSDGDDNQTNDRFKKDNGYHVVPPPLTGNYMPPLADLSFAGLDDSVYRPTTNKTSDSVYQVEKSTSQTSNTNVEMPRVESIRPSGVIIEDWFTNARNESVKPKQAEKPRIITQNPKVDRRDWNGKMTQKLGLGFGFTKKACFVCGSYSHLIKDYDFHEKRMAKKSVLKNMGKNTVLTRFGRVPVSAAKQSSLRATTSTSTFRPVNTATHTNRVNVSKLRTNAFHKSHSPIRRSFYKSTTPNTRISNEKVNTVRVNGVNTAGQTAVSAVKGNGVTAVKASAGCVWRPKMTDLNNVSKDNSGSWVSKRGNPQQALKNKGIFDSGCSRHMTGNKDFLTDYQDIDGGFVAFGGSARGGKITGKGKIRTNKLDFEDVFFVKELKFNRFSVSQMCDKKNNVLFTETECLVLSPDFKQLDECQVLLRVPRQSNMYSSDLKNVVPSRDLTCLFAKATIDESKLWHRRLGHVNFKTMNKLVNGNLVRGLPSNIFDNDHTFVACQKGKQHKASCKAKLVSSISKPLQMLHMDLFGPTSVRSINHKTYCLVVTDDFSRNLIEAARTMLADSLLPTVFWAEVVNIACYVLNRVLVTKPHNKTPYELIIGRPSSISFMRPFGCPVTILNTLDPLGKFDRKAEEGFLVGYSINSKAFRSSISSSYKSSDEKYKNDIADDAAGEIPAQKPASENEQVLKNVLDKMMDQEKEATKQSDAVRKEFEAQCNRELLQGKPTRASRTNSFNTVSTPVNAASTPRTYNDVGPSFVHLGGSFPLDVNDLLDDHLMPDLEDTAEGDFYNKMLDYGYNFMQTKIHVNNESAICVVKNTIYHSKTKHIEIRHHFIRDSYEKILIEMVKIHTHINVADLLTKAFDGTLMVFKCSEVYTSAIWIEVGMDYNWTTKKDTQLPQTSVPQDLKADEVIHKEGGGSPRRQDTMGGAPAQTRSERVLEQPNEPPLSEGHTSRSGEGRMEQTFDLTDNVPITPHDSPLLEGYTSGSDEDPQTKEKSQEIRKTKEVKHLPMKRRLFKGRVETSTNISLGEDASKQGRSSDKTKPMFKDSDFDVLDAEQITTTRPSHVSTTDQVSTARPEVSAATPSTPPTTIIVFDDEDVTMAMA